MHGNKLLSPVLTKMIGSGIRISLSPENTKAVSKVGTAAETAAETLTGQLSDSDGSGSEDGLLLDQLVTPGHDITVSQREQEAGSEAYDLTVKLFGSDDLDDSKSDYSYYFKTEAGNEDDSLLNQSCNSIGEEPVLPYNGNKYSANQSFDLDNSEIEASSFLDDTFVSQYNLEVRNVNAKLHNATSEQNGGFTQPRYYQNEITEDSFYITALFKKDLGGVIAAIADLKENESSYDIVKFWQEINKLNDIFLVKTCCDRIDDPTKLEAKLADMKSKLENATTCDIINAYGSYREEKAKRETLDVAAESPTSWVGKVTAAAEINQKVM